MDFGTIFLIVWLGTSFFVLVDANNIGAGKGYRTGFFRSMGPAGWFFSCLGLWIVAFPVYLSMREDLKAKALAARLPDQAAPGLSPAPQAASSSIADLIRLTELREKGTITEAEFQTLKTGLMHQDRTQGSALVAVPESKRLPGVATSKPSPGVRFGQVTLAVVIIAAFLGLAISSTAFGPSLGAAFGTSGHAQDQAAGSNMQGACWDLIEQFNKCRERGIPNPAIKLELESYLTKNHVNDKNPWQSDAPAYLTPIKEVSGLSEGGVIAAAKQLATVRGQVVVVIQFPSQRSDPAQVMGYLVTAVTIKNQVNGETTLTKLSGIE